MLGPREHSDQSSKRRLEADLCVRRWDLWNSRLLSDDELELGDEIEEQPGVRCERLTKLLSPLAQLGLGLGQELPDQTSESLGQRRVRNVAPELVELARREQPV